jgi:hypothetical protein
MHHPGVRAHVPLLQNLEQHSSLPPQELPAVRHEPLTGWHAPLAQEPLQQALLVEQAWLSPTQLVAHTPLLQLREQQSVPDAQAPPDAMHLPIVEPHVAVVASQVPEQHWLPV